MLLRASLCPLRTLCHSRNLNSTGHESGAVKLSKKELKLQKIEMKNQQKLKDRLEKEKAQKQALEHKLNESKKLVLEPIASPAHVTKIFEAKSLLETRIKVSGWVHNLRTQGNIIFILLRDGTGFLQCVLSGNLAKIYDALTLTVESSVTLYGTLKETPHGKMVF